MASTTFVTGNQGRPIQGVSQQPGKNRHPGQCTKSENYRPNVVRGLLTRPGTQHNGEFEGAPQGDSVKWHHYIREDEEYFISIDTSGVLKAWSPDGTEHTVNVSGDADDYLTTPDPSSNIETLTIGDYTFLINKRKVVLESASTSTALVNTAIVYVQFADYSQEIALYLDGAKVAWHKTENGEQYRDSESVRTTIIAAHLKDGMEGGSGTADDVGSWGGVDMSATFTATLDGNCLFIRRIDGADFDISVDDDADNSNTVAIFKEIEQLTLLPNRAPLGFKIKVNPPGGETTENASYWLQATETSGDSGNNLSWVECLEPGVSLGMDRSTMPVVLVRESITSGVATFSLRQGEWENREVGNDTSNPLPTFVNNTINTVGVMQNRLYLTSGESVIMTRSGNFFNFFRSTAQASLDTDPIDVYADSEQVNFLKASSSFDGDLVFFSDSAQFLLPGDKPLTGSNAVLRKTTNFETDLNAKPVESGDSIFFLINYGRYAGVREYFTDSVTDTKRARPITDHVNEYIEGTPKLMKTSTNLNTLLIKADADNVLYAYDWLWQGSDKVQSAWGKLVFSENSNILSMAFNDDKLRLVMLRPGPTVTCETIDLGDTDSEGLNFAVRLDRQKIGFMVLNSGVWEIDDPYPDEDVSNIRIVRSTQSYNSEIGSLLDFERVGDKLRAEGDFSEYSAIKVIIGISYNCSYIPTNPVAKDQNDQAMNLDRLTVGAYFVNYVTSGAVSAIVEDPYGNTRTLELSNRTFGGPENIIGFAPLVEGQHRIPIRAKSDRYTLTLNTDSHIPLAVRDFSFDGTLNRRGSRI